MYGENFFWEKQGSVSDTEPEGRVEKVETLPKELIPYRDTMRQWVESHIDDVNTFLQFGRTKFKIVYGDGFYHQPGTDTISLDVPHFKKYMDQGLGIEQAVFMPLFHEFAHLKTMAELGLAGKKNLCEHFNYEKGKEIQSKDDPTEFAQLHGTYRQFYNILEDTIVNFLVFETRHFGGVKGTREGRARGAIEQLYTDDFFPVYKNVGFGNGEYTFDQTSQSMVCVGEGNGDVEIMRKEDYENGFDWTKTESGSSKASQFLTFFMKHHMIGVKKEEIFTPENLEGSHVLDEDVAIALSQPLEKAYQTLLYKVFEKYANDPEKLERYIGFMKGQVAVAVYKESGGKVVREEKDTIVDNVFNRKHVKEDGTVNHHAAVVDYKTKIQNSATEMKKRLLAMRRCSFIDLFSEFKKYDTKKSTRGSLTIPLKHNLAERTAIVRELLEPIFSLLCILDDSFDVKIDREKPPEPPEPPESPPEPPESPEKEQTWEKGETVRINKQDSPNHGKKGKITDIFYENGEMQVQVEIYEEDKNSMRTEMSGAGKKVIAKEIFSNPNESLILVQEGEKKGGKGPKVEDKRKKESEKEEDEESDDSEKDGEGGENEEGKDKEPHRRDALNPFEEYLREAIEEGEKEEERLEEEERKRTPEYQREQEKNRTAEELLKKIRENRAENGEPQSSDSENMDRKLIQSYQNLEQKLTPFVHEMVKHWEQIVKNITEHIDIFKDKYFREGKPDYREMQKYLERMEYGEDIDRKRIYEQWVEVVKKEIQPKMLRVALLLDNSASMSEDQNKMRMVVMLLNRSLLSLREMFKTEMQIDFAYDVEIRTFGEKTKLIKPYRITDFSFLDAENAEVEFPPVNHTQSALDTIEAFRGITVNEGRTKDKEMWGNVIDGYGETEKALLKNGNITELILHISDGDISETGDVVALINHLKEECRVSTAGLAIGDEGAAEALRQRHGPDNVIPANTPAEIVNQFGVLLKKMMEETVQNPMIEHINNT